MFIPTSMTLTFAVVVYVALTGLEATGVPVTGDLPMLRLDLRRDADFTIGISHWKIFHRPDTLEAAQTCL